MDEAVDIEASKRYITPRIAPLTGSTAIAFAKI
jgi:hypothetical protein